MSDLNNKGEIVIYTAKDGSISLNTRLENETIWLTQKAMAELFGCFNFKKLHCLNGKKLVRTN